MDFRLLGPFQVCGHAQVLRLNRRQERCMLALLLMEPGRIIAADRLAGILWDVAPPSAAAVLSTYASRLRATLNHHGDSSLRLRRQGAGFLIEVDQETVDLPRFRAGVDRAGREPDTTRRSEILSAALAQWHGGSALSGIAPEPVRQRLAAPIEELRRVAIEMRAPALRAGGRPVRGARPRRRRQAGRAG